MTPIQFGVLTDVITKRLKFLNQSLLLIRAHPRENSASGRDFVD